jgi:hypothetical protein
MNSLLPLSPTSSILSGTRQAATIEVPASTVDSICQEYNISKVDILKLDIQGGELFALRGASRLLANKGVDIVYSEVNFNEIYTEQAYCHDISKLLNDYKYNLYGIYQMAYSPSGPIGWADALFVSPSIMEIVRHS